MSNPKCPNCGSLDTRKYLYGYPPANFNDKEFILGGDVLFESNPLYHCNNCGTDFGLRVGNVPGSNLLSQHTLENFTFTEYSPVGGTTRISVFMERGERKVEIEGTLDEDGDPNASAEYIVTTEIWEDLKERLINEVFILSWPADVIEQSSAEPYIWSIFMGFKNGKQIQLAGKEAHPPYYNELRKILDTYFVYD